MASSNLLLMLVVTGWNKGSWRAPWGTRQFMAEGAVEVEVLFSPICRQREEHRCT